MYHPVHFRFEIVFGQYFETIISDPLVLLDQCYLAIYKLLQNFPFKLLHELA